MLVCPRRDKFELATPRRRFINDPSSPPQAGLVTFLGDFYAFAFQNCTPRLFTAVFETFSVAADRLIEGQRAWSVMTSFVFAQNAGGGGAAGGNPPPPTLFSPWTMFFAASLFLFYALVLAPEKRRKAERDHQLAKLKKNDRVITSGGIHGTVVATSSSSADDDDLVVTIKVDSNTRLKINRSAISVVVAEESSGDNESSGEKN